MSEEMKIDPARAQGLISQIGAVKDRIANVANGRNARKSPRIPNKKEMETLKHCIFFTNFYTLWLSLRSRSAS